MNNKEKKKDGKKLTTTQNLRSMGCGTLCTTVLTPIKTEDVWSKDEFQNRCGSKPTLGILNYWTLYSSLFLVEWKHTLTWKCTALSASRFFHRFLNNGAHPALHTIKIPCPTNSARITLPNTLLFSWTRICPRAIFTSSWEIEHPSRYLISFHDWAFSKLNTVLGSSQS